MDLENKVSQEELVKFYSLLGVNPEKDLVFTKFQQSGSMWNDVSKSTFGPYGCSKGLERAIRLPQDIVVIDIDNSKDFDRIVDYIKKLSYNAIVVGSDKNRVGGSGHERGGQIYFRRPSFWTEAGNIQHRFTIAPLVSHIDGIEYKAQTNISGGVNIKTPMSDYHKKYFIYLPDSLDELPLDLYPINTKESMISKETMIEYCKTIDEADGRYEMLMKYHSTLAMNIINNDNISFEDWQQVLLNVNQFCGYSDDKNKTERQFTKELANRELYRKDLAYAMSIQKEKFGFEHGVKPKETPLFGPTTEQGKNEAPAITPKNTIIWGSKEKRDEIKKYSQFIEDNAAPLPGLPHELKLLPGDNVGISAPTGSGKTTWLVSIAINNLNLGKKVMMLVLEETEIETRYRILLQLNKDEYDNNLAIVEVESFKQSTFKQDMLNLLDNSGADIVLVDYINDSFCIFDQSPGLAAFEKIKYTVSMLCDLNHRVLKNILIIGVQGTVGLLTAKQDAILVSGKSYFEGGQSTIKPLQYAILLKDAHIKEDNDYEKYAYIIKSRSVLVGGNKMVVPTYGVSYHKDKYAFDLLGSLKDIVAKSKEEQETRKEEKKREKEVKKLNTAAKLGAKGGKDF